MFCNYRAGYSLNVTGLVGLYLRPHSNLPFHGWGIQSSRTVFNNARSSVNNFIERRNFTSNLSLRWVFRISNFYCKHLKKLRTRVQLYFNEWLSVYSTLFFLFLGPFANPQSLFSDLLQLDRLNREDSFTLVLVGIDPVRLGQVWIASSTLNVFVFLNVVKVKDAIVLDQGLGVLQLDGVLFCQGGDRVLVWRSFKLRQELLGALQTRNNIKNCQLNNDCTCLGPHGQCDTNINMILSAS